MHDMRVTFNFHKGITFDGAEFRHPSNIIASEIDEHQMLGTFLLVSKQLQLKRFVLLRRFAAWPRPGNRHRLYTVAVHLDKCLGRSTDNDFITHFQIVHIWRWIHRTQHPIYMQRINIRLDAEALG
ncbi:hypothetical protein D3C78_1457300 [compost metagenome]